MFSRHGRIVINHGLDQTQIFFFRFGFRVFTAIRSRIWGIRVVLGHLSTKSIRAAAEFIWSIDRFRYFSSSRMSIRTAQLTCSHVSGLSPTFQDTSFCLAMPVNLNFPFSICKN
jgi:hypothetical protein